MKPFLTVISASFNSAHTIDNMIESLLNQNFNNMELLIIDGGSSDETITKIRSFENEFQQRSIHFEWLSEPDSGIYDAWNKGLKKAKGKWISFIGTDDRILPGIFSLMAKKAEEFPDADFLSGKARIIKDSRTERVFGKEWKWDEFKKEMKILHAGGWHNALYFEQFGSFDTSFKIVGDYEMLLRSRQNLKMKFLDQYIIEMGADGVSSTQVKKALLEVKKAKIKNKIRNHLFATIDYHWVYLKIIFRQYVRKMA